MTLNDWLANRWLTNHETSPQEIADLRAVVERDLKDANVDRLSADWRVGISYNAALQLAIMALAAAGYRTERQRPHERAIQSLRFTVGIDQRTIDTLDAVRRMRNLGNYERAGTVSESEAQEVFDLAMDLRTRVTDWLRQEHPELL